LGFVLARRLHKEVSGTIFGKIAWHLTTWRSYRASELKIDKIARWWAYGTQLAFMRSRIFTTALWSSVIAQPEYFTVESFVGDILNMGGWTPVPLTF